MTQAINGTKDSLEQVKINGENTERKIDDKITQLEQNIRVEITKKFEIIPSFDNQQLINIEKSLNDCIESTE